MLARSKGGTKFIGNLVPACDSCNQEKQDRPIWTMVGK